MFFSECIKIREEKFGAVVFNTLSEKVFVTNETGKSVLASLKEGKAVAEIIESLADEYNIESRVDMEEEVADFVKALLENGLLKNGDPDAGR